jgi:hypothetical protein
MVYWYHVYSVFCEMRLMGVDSREKSEYIQLFFFFLEYNG